MKNLIKGKWYQCRNAPRFCIFKFDYYEKDGNYYYYYTAAFADYEKKYNGFIGNKSYFDFVEAEELLVLKYFPDEAFESNYEIY